MLQVSWYNPAWKYSEWKESCYLHLAVDAFTSAWQNGETTATNVLFSACLGYELLSHNQKIKRNNSFNQAEYFTFSTWKSLLRMRRKSFNIISHLLVCCFCAWQIGRASSPRVRNARRSGHAIGKRKSGHATRKGRSWRGRRRGKRGWHEGEWDSKQTWRIGE